MEPFSSIQASGPPRRAFLLMPVAFAGLLALYSRRDRPLPDAARSGAGADIELVIFSDHGRNRKTVVMQKIVKTDAEWRSELTPEEFAVARKRGTERAFTGRYWNNHANGLYACVCCGVTLFRSQEKFESGTGWPRQPVHGPGRGPVRQVRRPSGPSLRRRPRTHQPAVLHQLRGAPVRSRRFIAG